MSRKRKQKIYFGVEQEQAVVRYLTSSSELEKNKIFNEFLSEPLIIMVESIIRRYKLHRKGMSFEDNHSDTISFLMTKVDRFDVNENKLAYSYFGTICKNYLLGNMQKDSKEFNRNISYDDISSSIEDNADLSYTIDEYHVDYKEVLNKYIEKLEVFIETETLTENELKMGFALLEIFSNIETIFQLGDGNKFNKNLILFLLREMTFLSTKEIRISLKRYKKLYDGILNKFLD